MANRGKRISELTALTSASLDTTIVGIDNGTTYKIELDILADAVTSRVNILDRDRLASLESVTSSFETKGRNVISGSSQLTSSFDERYVASGSITQTTWDNIASKPTDIISSSTQISDLGFISSSHTDITSLNSFTSSQSSLNTAFTNGIGARLQTSSFNEYTASQSTSSLVDRLNSIESETGSFLTSLNGAISSSEQVLGSSGVYSSSAQINGNIYSAGSSVTIQDILVGAGTTFGKITTDGSKYISVMPTYNTESARFWANGNVTIQTGGEYVDNGYRLEVSGSTRIVGSFDVTDGITGSTNFDTIVNKPTLISGSFQLTSSFDERYTLSGSVQSLPSGLISGSSQLTSSYDTRYTLSGSVVSGTTPAGTISGSSQLTSSFDGRYVQTGSFNTLTASFNSFTASAQSVTTGSNSFNGTQTITGSLIITTGSFVGSQILANTSSLYLTSGSNMYVQNNGVVEITGSLKVNGITRFETVGGDEGGEIEFGVPQTNTTLSTRVVQDIWQNRLRIFDGNTKGVFIDLSKAPIGVAGEITWKASGYVDAGTFVQLDNIKATVTTSSNRGLSIGAVSTNFSANIGGTFSNSAGAGGNSTQNIAYTTTASTSVFGWNFIAEGDTSTYIINDKTNSRMYRITMMIGPAYLGNFISIERLH